MTTAPFDLLGSRSACCDDFSLNSSVHDSKLANDRLNCVNLYPGCASACISVRSAVVE